MTGTCNEATILFSFWQLRALKLNLHQPNGEYDPPPTTNYKYLAVLMLRYFVNRTEKQFIGRPVK